MIIAGALREYYNAFEHTTVLLTRRGGRITPVRLVGKRSVQYGSMISVSYDVVFPDGTGTVLTEGECTLSAGAWGRFCRTHCYTSVLDAWYLLSGEERPR